MMPEIILLIVVVVAFIAIPIFAFTFGRGNYELFQTILFGGGAVMCALVIVAGLAFQAVDDWRVSAEWAQAAAAEKVHTAAGKQTAP